MAPRVALAMIVRNEAAVIARCLASARPFIDAWVICDTGSTDDTPARVQAALAGIPGRLLHRPWVNFGHNRTELLALARDAADYLLLLDADMTVAGDPGALTALTADAYDVTVEDGGLTYRLPCLVRADRPWRYEGVTHEALVVPPTATWGYCAGLRIRHHADGGMRADKLTRDRALLEAAVAARPDDARSVFYLAQTYRDLGDRAQAVALYRRRVALGGWAEEQFYAQYQVGVLLAPTAWPAAVEALLTAWNLRPTRAEPWHALAVGWRQRQQWALAYWAASTGTAISEPADRLFVETAVYRWGLPFERSLAAYYTGRHAEARALYARLAADPALPEPWRSAVAANAPWFTGPR
jgi:tetratricopeptide (TPR) repeat protein